jgi:chromosomal replication initiation ATPase DnaA
MDTPQAYFTRIEIEIHRFIDKYGVDELINWLKEYSKSISQSDFNYFKRIQAVVCEVYQIPIADINSTNSTNIEYAEAKRLISYLTIERTKLKPKHVCKLQNCTQRTISNHLSDVKYRIKNPNGFKSFMNFYKQTIEKLDHANTRTAT